MIAKIEVDTAFENLKSITEGYIKELQETANDGTKEDRDRIKELEEELQEERDLAGKEATTHEIEFEKLDTLSYRMENGNLWVEQIMENIEKIVELKGTKYLHDRLEITLKAIVK